MNMPPTERERILAALTHAPQTAPTLASLARVNPCSVYQHLWSLSREGLARYVEQRVTSRTKARFFWSLPESPKSEPKTTTEAAPPSVEVQAEPKAEPPKGTQELQPKEDAPPIQDLRQPDPQASPEPCNVDLLIQQIRARHTALMAQADAILSSKIPVSENLIAQRHRALLASGRIQGGHLR